MDQSWTQGILESALGMQEQQQREIVLPFLLVNRIIHDSADVAQITLKHLKALANLWELPSREPGFSRKYITVADYLRLLSSHAIEIEKKGRKASPKRSTFRSSSSLATSPDAVKPVMTPYAIGDKFSTRGSYDEGLIYKSRLQGSRELLPERSEGFHAGFLEPTEDEHTEIGSEFHSEAEGSDEKHATSLLEISLSDDMNLKKNCAAALARLTGKPGFRPGILQASGIPALVAMYNTPDSSVKHDSAVAICNLVPAVKDVAALKNGALHVILNGLQNDDSTLKEQCLDTLLDLSAREEGDPQGTLLEHGLIPVLTSLTRAVIQEHSTELSEEERRNGKVPTLLWDKTVLAILGRIGELLHVFAERKPNRIPLVQDGALALTLELLTVGRAGKEPGSLDPKKVDRAVGRLTGEHESVMETQNNAQEEELKASEFNEEDIAQLAGLRPSSTEVAINPRTIIDPRRKATAALNQIIQSRELLPQILEAGLIPWVVQVSKGTSAAADSAAEAMAELAGHTEGRVALVQGGALSALIARARDENSRGRHRATGTLRELSTDPACRENLLELGTVPALVSLSVAGDEEVQRDCAVALCSLLLTPSTGSSGKKTTSDHSKILEMGALGTLSALARSDEEELQSKAAETLCDLSVDEELGRKMVEAGGLETLLELCRCQSIEIKESCAIALHNLSCDSQNHGRMLNEGAVGAIIEMTSKAKGFMVAAGQKGKPPMEADSQGASPDPRSGTAVSVVRSCAAGLSNLSFHTAKHILFMEGGALPSLIDMARTKDEQTRSRVATGLCNITYHEASCEACIKSGDVPVLLALARANHENTKRDCAAALCNLSNYVGGEESLAKDGAASGLIMLALFRADTPETRHLCVCALFNLLSAPASRQKLVGDEVIWAFTKLVATGSCIPSTNRIAARALVCLSCDSKFRPALLTQKTVPALTQLCSIPNDIAEGGDSENQGPLSGKRARMRSDLAFIRRASAMAIRNLTSDAPQPMKVPYAVGQRGISAFHMRCDQMLQDGCLTMINQLSRAPEESVIYHTSAALCNLTCDPHCGDFMAREGISSILVRLCQSENPKVLQYCAIAIANISTLAPRLPALIRQKFVAPCNVVARSNDIETVKIAAMAIYNLSCCGHAKSIVTLVEGGITRGIWSIVTFILGTDKPFNMEKGWPEELSAEQEAVLRTMSAASANLCSIHDATAKFSSSGGAKALALILSFSRRADVLLYAVHALCNITAQATNISSVVSVGLMPVLRSVSLLGVEGTVMDMNTRRRPMIHGADEPLHFSLALRRGTARVILNLVHDPAARERLAEERAVETIVRVCGLLPADEFHEMENASEYSNAGDEMKDEIERDPKSLKERKGMRIWLPNVRWQIADELLRTAGGTLWHLTMQASNVCNAALLREKGVAALVELCRKDNRNLQNLAATALNNISYDAPRRKRLFEEGAVDVLTHLARSPHHPTKEAATVALRNITMEGDSQDRMMEDGGVEMLVQLMMAGSQDSEEGNKKGLPGGGCKPSRPIQLMGPVEEALDGIRKGIGLKQPVSRPQTHSRLFKVPEDPSEYPEWRSVAETPHRAASTPFVEAVKVVDKRPTGAPKPTDDDGYGFSDPSDDIGRREQTSDCPGPYDLDEISQHLMWDKVGGRTMASSGFASRRNRQQEEESRKLELMEASPLSTLRRARTAMAGTREGAQSEPSLQEKVDSYFHPRLRGTWADSPALSPIRSPDRRQRNSSLAVDIQGDSLSTMAASFNTSAGAFPSSPVKGKQPSSPFGGAGSPLAGYGRQALSTKRY